MNAKETLAAYMADMERVDPATNKQPLHTPETQAEICALRMAAFQEHVDAMEVPQVLREWAALMQARYGSRIQVWHVKYTSWLVALMIVRYGEDVGFWPEEFSDSDIIRAQQWDAENKHPQGIRYHADPRLSTTGKIVAGVAALLMASYFAVMGSDWVWYTAPFILFGTAMTDYLENKIIDHLFRTTTFTQPAVLAVALFTAAPGETGGGTEVSGGSYARVSNNPLNTNWNATQGGTSGASSGTGGLTSNAGILTYPTPSANWGSITHFALFDATTVGNMLIYGTLTNAKTVNNGDPAPTFAAAALTVTAA